MYKKKYCFLAMVVTCSAVVMAGCANNPKADDTGEADEAVIENTVDDESANNTEGVDETSLDISMIYRFSEGMEWVRTRSTGSVGDSYVCVDKEGNALFSVDASTVSGISPFSNGYSFIETDNAVYQIDVNGNIINTYSILNNTTVKAYDEGQVWTEEYKSDFDSAGYRYILHDENGKEVTEFSIEGTEPVNDIEYCGKGVWRYGHLNSDSDWVEMYYCTQGDKWVERKGSSDGNVYFYEDLAVLGMDYEDPDETGYRAKMILMDITGNLSEVKLTGDLGWNWASDNYVNEGYCILEDYEDHLVSYNVSSGEFKVMDNEYAEKIRMPALSDQLMFIDGCVALPLRGTDEEDYVGLFDTSWNIIGEPIPGTRFDFSEGKLMIEQNVSSEEPQVYHKEVVVYDTKGTQIFNASEKGYAYITDYEDGIAYVRDASKTGLSSDLLKEEDTLGVLDYDWKCIDEKGEYLFDTINSDNIKTIEI